MQVDADVEEARRFFESTNPDEILLRAWADRPTAGRSTVEYRFAEVLLADARDFHFSIE